MHQKLSVDKRADILQSTFKHYFSMAMDHHTKATTTSHILLIIVAAIIGLVGHGNQLRSVVGFAGGLVVSCIGLFGSVWVWKQHERYHYWENIAYKYQEELTKIVPGWLKTGRDKEYKCAAEKAAAKDFGELFAKHILDRYLWVSLHIIVAIIGLVLMAVSKEPNGFQIVADIVVGLIVLFWVVTLIMYGICAKAKQEPIARKAIRKHKAKPSDIKIPHHH